MAVEAGESFIIAFTCSASHFVVVVTTRWQTTGMGVLRWGRGKYAKPDVQVARWTGWWSNIFRYPYLDSGCVSHVAAASQ